MCLVNVKNFQSSNSGTWMCLFISHTLWVLNQDIKFINLNAVQTIMKLIILSLTNTFTALKFNSRKCTKGHVYHNPCFTGI